MKAQSNSRNPLPIPPEGIAILRTAATNKHAWRQAQKDPIAYLKKRRVAVPKAERLQPRSARRRRDPSRRYLGATDRRRHRQARLRLTLRRRGAMGGVWQGRRERSYPGGYGCDRGRSPRAAQRGPGAQGFSLRQAHQASLRWCRGRCSFELAGASPSSERPCGSCARRAARCRNIARSASDTGCSKSAAGPSSAPT